MANTVDVEKRGNTPQHDTDTVDNAADEFKIQGKGVIIPISQDELPEGYFRSRYFLGSLAATCFNLAAGVGGFALIAPILGQINADIGPSSALPWTALVYTIGLTIGLTLVGRLSDLFGRRWFFISGNIVGIVGCIVCATANTVPVLIGGETLLGLAAATGASYPFVLGELVPMKYRFVANSLVYLFQLPTSCFGPAVAYYFVLYTEHGWRCCYYYLIAWNAVALVLFALCYYPPTFQMKHSNETKRDWFLNFDYIGTILFAAGIVLFLLGLSWGGSVYPWKSAHVIATLVVGVLTLMAFGFYEVFLPGKAPLVPVYLFKRGRWVATTVVVSFCGGVFYAFAIVWPTMVATLYNKADDPMYTGYVACVVGSGITLGQIIGGILAVPIGRARYQTIASFGSGAIFLAAMATCDENSRTRAIVLLLFGTTLIGYADSLATTITTIYIQSQADIGIASGVVGAIRTAVGAVCQTVYVVILTNRLAQTISGQVPPAVIGAGLPKTSVASFLEALSLGTPAAFSAVEDLTPEIITAGTAAFKSASSDAYRTVFLSTIAFGGVGFILTWFVPDVDDRMTTEVTAILNNLEDVNNKLEE